jgi:small-conductance mechanosensitive channel
MMIDPQTWPSVVSDLTARAVAYLPSLLLALVILMIGWAVARLLAALARRLARRLRLDGAVERGGLAEGLAQAKITRPASDLVALLIFWLVFLAFVLLALEILGWTLAILLLQKLIAYLPRLLAAILILVIGAWLAQALGKVAQAAVASMGVEYHEGIGRLVQGLLLTVTAVLAVEQLGLNLTFLTDALTNLLTIVVAGLALAFGLGGRDVVRNVLAGYYARDQFTPGEGLVVDGEVGTLESIGTVSTQISVGEEILVVPNVRLTEGTVQVRKNAPVEQESTN